MKITPNLLITLGSLLCLSIARSETVTVNLAAAERPVSYASSGILHGLTATEPAAKYFEGIKPQLVRFRANLWDTTGAGGVGFNSPGFMARIAAVPHKQVVLSDEFRNYGYHIPTQANPGYGWPHSGKPVAQAKLMELITNIHNTAVSKGITFQWDIWNEPDPAWSTENWGYPLNPNDLPEAQAAQRANEQLQFFDTYRQAYLKIRQLDPSAIIVGPSLSGYNEPYLKAFLLFCKNNGNCYPNYLSWHELNGDSNHVYSWKSSETIHLHAAAIRSWMASQGMPVLPISINEITAPEEAFSPGRLSAYFYSLEKARDHGVVNAARACWNDIPNDNSSNTSLGGRMDGLMTATVPHVPRASWHLHKAYADMTGNMVQLNPSANLSGVASLGPNGSQVIIGNKGNSHFSATVVVNNAHHLPGYNLKGGKVFAVVRHIPGNSGLNAVYEPPVFVKANINGINNTLTLNLNFAPHDAYTIALSNTPQWPLALKTGGNLSEVHILDGYNNYSTYNTHTTIPISGTDNGHWDFLFENFDGDGVPDLFIIKKANTDSGMTELFVLSSASNYQTYTFAIGTGLHLVGSEWKFALADHNGDGKLDLYCFNRAHPSHLTSLHILSGASDYQNFIYHSLLPVAHTNDDNAWDWQVGNVTGDAAPEITLVCKTGWSLQQFLPTYQWIVGPGVSGQTVFLTLGSGNYQTWVGSVATPLAPSNANWRFSLTDYDCNGSLDMFCILKTGGSSGSTEIHALNGSSYFNSWLLHTGTDLGYTTPNWVVDGGFNK